MKNKEKKKQKKKEGEVPTAITLIKKVQIVKGAWGIRMPNVLTAVNERAKCRRNGPSSLVRQSRAPLGN